MKTLMAASVLFFGTLILTGTFSSCAKPDHSADAPKEQLVLGTWMINRIQLRIYNNNVFQKDTIIPNKALPKNFVQFDANTNFQYCYNSATVKSGTYQFKGADSVISTTPSTTYRWKMLTLTDVLFTVMSTSTNDPAFPGAKVETYQTWVR